MLRNVAIPLMLAASEAEAANPPIKPTERMVERALNEDRAKPFPGLIADAVTCTVGTTDKLVKGTVAAADALLTSAKDALKKANEAVAKSTAVKGVNGAAADGAWTAADAARKKAVDAAVGLEINAKTGDGKDNTIPGLIDKQDAADADERAKAAAYWAAKLTWDQMTAAVKTATTARDNAKSMAETLKKAAATAFTATKGIQTQLTNERDWRSWLYCELGAAAGITDEQKSVFDVDGGSNKKWYNMLPGALNDVKEPTSCTVPKSDKRIAVQYFFAASDPTAKLKDGTDFLSQAELDKSYDGAKRWSAKLAADQAKAAIDATKDAGGNKYDATGQVAYWTGAKKRADWILENTTQEAAFYKYVEDARVLVATETAKWVKSMDLKTGGWKDDTKAPGALIGSTQKDGTVTTCKTDGTDAQKSACNSPTKELPLAMKAWNENKVSGSNLLVGATSAAGGTSGEEWDMTWKTDITSMDAFITANKAADVKNKQTQDWQTDASAFSKLVQEWYEFDWVKYLDSEQSGTTTNVEKTETSKTESCDTDKVGDNFTDTQVKKYKTIAKGDEVTIDTPAKCFQACLAYTQYHIMQRTTAQDVFIAGSAAPFDLGSDAAYTTSLFGVQSFPQVSKNAKVCYAASFLTAGKICKFNTTEAKASADTGKGGVCTLMTKGGSKTDVATMLTMQKNLVAAWAKVAPTTLKENANQTKVRDALPASATLQTAWLEAWYDQQYWASIDTNLATGKEDKVWADIAKVVNAKDAKLSTNATGAKAVVDNAKGELSGATANLTLWKATKTNADTNKQNIVDRISNSTTEIANLLTFSDGKTADGVVPSSGAILDARYKTQLDAYNAYIKGFADPKKVAEKDWGTQQKAVKALEDAVAKVGKNNTDPKNKTTDTGKYNGTGQAKVMDAAKEAWDAAVKSAKDAADALTKALGANDLQKLRDAVKEQAGKWKDANGILTKQQATVVTEQANVAAAEKALAAATVACQVKAYDAYRKDFETRMVKRGNDLIEIKKLITAELTRAVAGDEGSRCEKAPSNGDWRPDREEERVCVSGLCCGAARIWYKSGTTKDAAWRTIESCQPSGATKYKYQPPRPPMAIKEVDKVEVNFACIEGAQRLAAAAAAMAAAYMLA